MISMGTRLFSDNAFFKRRKLRFHQESARVVFRMVERNPEISLDDIYEGLLAYYKLVDLVIGPLAELRFTMQPELARDPVTGRVTMYHAHDAVVGFHGSKAFWKVGLGRQNKPRFGFVGTETTRIRMLFAEPSLALFHSTIAEQLEGTRVQLSSLSEWVAGMNRYFEWQVPQALELLQFDINDWKRDLHPAPCTCDTATCLEHRQRR